MHSASIDAAKVVGQRGQASANRAYQSGAWEIAIENFGGSRDLLRVSELGLDIAVRGTIFKLSPVDVKELSVLTIRSIGLNIPGLSALYDGFLEFAEEIFG